MTPATVTTKRRPLLIHTAAADDLRASGLTVVAAGDDHWQITWPNRETATVNGAGLELALGLLGRGVLTPDALQAEAQPDPMMTIAPLQIPLDQLLDNPYQPRLDYDPERITAIATSIATHGLLQAPIGRRRPDGRVELAFGHSRRRAFSQLAESDPARYGAMPVVLRVLDDETMALHAWVENRDRKDLSAYEEARAIQRYTTEFGWSQKAAAQKMQLDASTVSNKLRLLRLPDATLAQLQAGQLSERQALALLPLMDLPEATRAQRVNVWISGGGTAESADALLSGAGRYDSATIRILVERMLSDLSKPLAKVSWRGEVFVLEPGMQAATCAECPMRIKASDRCMDPACFALKLRAHQARGAAAAAESLGLPAVGDLSYSEYTAPSGVTLATLQIKAVEKKCGNLAVRTGGYSGLEVPGFPNCYAICAHGAGKRCGCMQSLARSSDPTASADALKRHNRAKIDAELIGPATQQLQAAFARPTVGMWRLWLSRVEGETERKLPKEATIAEVQAALARALVGSATYWDRDNGQVTIVERALTKLLESCGAPIPWDLRANVPAVPADVQARAAALGITIHADFAISWGDADQLGCEDLDDLEETLVMDAIDTTALLLASGAVILPGITFDPATKMIAADYKHVCALVSTLAAAEAGSGFDLWGELGSDLEGCAEVLDDATYTALATRIAAQQTAAQAVAA